MQSWRRTYWSVWIANLITSIGMMSFLPFLPSLLEEVGVEGEERIALWSGLVFGAAPLSAAFMGPVWGALGDRIGRRLMVVRALLAIALFVGAMAFVASPWTLLALRIGQGLFSGFIPPSITLVSVAAPPGKQGRVAADLHTALALGAIIGPLVGGWFAARGGYQDVFLWVALAALLGAALVWFGAKEDSGQRRPTGEGRSVRVLVRALIDDLGVVWQAPRVRSAVILLFFLQFGIGATEPQLELYVRELFPAGGELGPLWATIAGYLSDGHERATVVAFATSLLFGGVACVILIALPLWGRYGDRVGHGAAVLTCSLGVSLALLVQALAPTYPMLFAGRLLLGAVMAGAGPLAIGLAAEEIAVDRRGGAFGVVFSARLFGKSVGAGAGGVLAGVLGIRGLLVFAALILVAALLRTRRALGRARR